MPTQEDRISLRDQIAAFDEMRDVLERDHYREWVVFHDGELVDTYDTFEAAADDAVVRFGRGPYLIRQVGAPPVRLHLPQVQLPVDSGRLG